MILYADTTFEGHAVPPGHPERPERMRAIREVLADLRLDRRGAPEATDAQLLACHTQDHLNRLAAAVPPEGIAALDADTWISPGSLGAARRAAGAACAAVDAIVAGGRAFVAARPPGHHAEGGTPMGFCLFGTAAIAARHAMDAHGLRRVAVADFDVHHGNGTQDLLGAEPRALFANSFQSPLWPGTGGPEETGAAGQVVSRTLAPGAGGAEFRRLWERGLLPAMDAFAPELVIVSAGFDAHEEDPLAQLALHEDDFGWITAELARIADDHAGGRLVSCLEGGYDLPSLGRSVRAHVIALEGGE